MSSTRQPEVEIKDSVRAFLHVISSHCSVGLALDIFEWMRVCIVRNSCIRYQTDEFLASMPGFPLCPRAAVSYDLATGERLPVDPLPKDSSWHDILIDRLFESPNDRRHPAAVK